MCFIQVNFKLNKQNKDWNWIMIEWFWSTDAKDCDSDIVKYSAWDTKTINEFLNNPQMLLSHDFNKSIWRWLKLERKISWNKKGLWVEWVVEHDLIEDWVSIKERIRKWTVRTLSIWFIPLKYKWINKKGEVLADEFWLKFWIKDEDLYKEWVVRYISKVELFEISVVNIPANSQAIFALQKSLKINNYFILQNFKNMKTKLNLNVFKWRRTKEASISLDQIETEFNAVETVIEEVKTYLNDITLELDTVEKKIEDWIAEEDAKLIVSDLETMKQEIITNKDELVAVEWILEQVNVDAMTKELSEADAEMVKEKIDELTSEVKEEIVELEKNEERITSLYEKIWVNSEDESTDETITDPVEWEEITTEGEDTKEIDEEEVKEKKEDIKEEITKENLTEMIKQIIKELIPDDNSWNKADEISALEKSFSDTVTSLNDKVDKMATLLAKAQSSAIPVVSTVKSFKIDTTWLSEPKSFSKKRA